MDKLYFDVFCLGSVIEDIIKVEFILRDVDIVVMDVVIIKYGDLSYKYYNSFNGFDSREICVIVRYVGISNCVSFFGLYELKEFI